MNPLKSLQRGDLQYLRILTHKETYAYSEKEAKKLLDEANKMPFAKGRKHKSPKK